MNIIKDVINIYGGEGIARGFFIFQFGLLVLYSLTALLKQILLEVGIRKMFVQRVAFVETLFGLYHEKKQKIEEQKRAVEEVRRAAREAAE